MVFPSLAIINSRSLGCAPPATSLPESSGVPSGRSLPPAPPGTGTPERWVKLLGETTTVDLLTLNWDSPIHLTKKREESTTHRTHGSEITIQISCKESSYWNTMWIMYRHQHPSGDSQIFSATSEYLRPGDLVTRSSTNQGQAIATHGICRLSKVELAPEVPHGKTADISSGKTSRGCILNLCVILMIVPHFWWCSTLFLTSFRCTPPLDKLIHHSWATSGQRIVSNWWFPRGLHVEETLIFN